MAASRSRRNAGEKRSKPLQHLATNSANRGTSDKTRGLRAPAITAAPPASVQATASGAPAATSFGAFEGINQATSTFEPPDPWVAVGPDDVVQSTNTMLRFSNREGDSTAGDVQLFDFFAFDELVPGQPDFIDGIGDPHWLYDAKHNRWIGTTLAWHCDTDGAGTTDDSLGFVWGAISLTGDPTGDYYQFYILYNSFLPDFPAVGTSADKFAITANEFILSDQPDCTVGHPVTTAASVTAFDWTQMLTSPAVPDITYEFDTGWFALRPAVQPQSQSNTLYVVGEKLLPSPAGDTTSDVVYMNVTGTNAAGGTTLSAEKDLTTAGVVPGFVDPPVPIQPGGALAADILDRRPTDAIWQDNVLDGRLDDRLRPCGRRRRDPRLRPRDPGEHHDVNADACPGHADRDPRQGHAGTPVRESPRAGSCTSSTRSRAPPKACPPTTAISCPRTRSTSSARR